MNKNSSEGEQELSGQAVESPIAALSGRELDAAVAERVMGWLWLNHNGTSVLIPRGFSNRTDFHWMPAGIEEKPTGRIRYLTGLDFSAGVSLPRYSTDIAAAMEVVEKMRSEGWSFACTLYDGELPYASFCKRTAASSRNAEASTLPEAICRAALAAKGI